MDKLKDDRRIKDAKMPVRNNAGKKGCSLLELNHGAFDTIDFYSFEDSRGVNLGYSCDASVHVIETREKPAGTAETI